MYDPRQNPRAQLSTVENLCSFSIPMMRQPWQRVYVKDTDKGPMVWEIKHAPIWLSRDGSILGPYWLIYARNLLDPGEVKYFLSNASPGTPLESIVHVAFARWPVERTLEDEKDELGLSHFEVRKYHSIMRHLSVTQVSHLFLARQTERLRGEKPGDHVVSGPDRCERASRCVPLPKRARTERLEKASYNLHQTQDQNRRARRSHTKTRLSRLKRMGIPLADLACCIPHNSPSSAVVLILWDFVALSKRIGHAPDMTSIEDVVMLRLAKIRVDFDCLTKGRRGIGCPDLFDFASFLRGVRDLRGENVIRVDRRKFTTKW